MGYLIAFLVILVGEYGFDWLVGGPWQHTLNFGIAVFWTVVFLFYDHVKRTT